MSRAAAARLGEAPGRPGDRRPFEEVVAEHGAAVMRVCRALLAPADAADAWSETFLAALRAWPRLRPASDVRAWLVTIAHRKSVDQIRGAARRPEPASHLPETAAPEPPAAADAELRAALERLPEKQRGAVVYHHLADLPYAAVGEILGCSAEAARRSAADGVAALRRHYRKGRKP
jgi:RNA polymerase sigma factor (sigma-70 family)